MSQCKQILPADGCGQREEEEEEEDEEEEEEKEEEAVKKFLPATQISHVFLEPTAAGRWRDTETDITTCFTKQLPDLPLVAGGRTAHKPRPLPTSADAEV